MTWLKSVVLMALALLALACHPRLGPTAGPARPAIVPWPMQIVLGSGRLPLTDPLPVAVVATGDKQETAELLRLAGVLVERLPGLALGGRVSIAAAEPSPGTPPIGITLLLGGNAAQLGAEGYDLRIDGNGARLQAVRPAGLFYGVQTLLQLLPAPVFGRVPMRPSPGGITLPYLRVVDRPRFAWRGFMLDCCRHFFAKEFVKRSLDVMALHKLNLFHWHLTDDQGWRLEIKKYPELTRVGGYRIEADGRRSGGFYSQDDVREIVTYAAERYITVVPEIEMPGHAMAALAAYPELSCTGGPFAVTTTWGVFPDVYCAGNDHTLDFLAGVLDEVTGLFPGSWVHVGGDECPKDRWLACPRCRARMAAEGLVDGTALQSWFTRRIEAMLAARGRRLIGWDEILEGGLAPRAAVMSWRGTEGGIAAARQGHDVVMAPTSHCYFDYYQGRAEDEPTAIGGFLPLAKVYAFEPLPAGLAAGEAAHILGGQANLWTEYVTDEGHAEYMILPRLCALAEALWTPRGERDYADFWRRLQRHRGRLAAMGLQVASGEPAALR